MLVCDTGQFFTEVGLAYLIGPNLDVAGRWQGAVTRNGDALGSKGGGIVGVISDRIRP